MCTTLQSCLGNTVKRPWDPQTLSQANMLDGLELNDQKCRLVFAICSKWISLYRAGSHSTSVAGLFVQGSLTLQWSSDCNKEPCLLDASACFSFLHWQCAWCTHSTFLQDVSLTSCFLKVFTCSYFACHYDYQFYFNLTFTWKFFLFRV